MCTLYVVVYMDVVEREVSARVLGDGWSWWA